MKETKKISIWTDLIQRFCFFHLVVLGWLIFRADSLGQIWQMLYDLIFHFNPNSVAMTLFGRLLLICLPLWVIQMWQVRTNNLMILYRQHWIIQTMIYAVLTYLVVGWGILRPEEFVYFQF